jgi:hypothetical protein
MALSSKAVRCRLFFVPRAHSQAGSDFGNLKPLYPKGCALAIVEVRGGKPWHEERIRTIATLAVMCNQGCVLTIPVRVSSSYIQKPVNLRGRLNRWLSVGLPLRANP